VKTSTLLFAVLFSSRLTWASPVTVTVVDDHAAPIFAARVAIVTPGRTPIDPRITYEAVTGPDGRCDFLVPDEIAAASADVECDVYKQGFGIETVDAPGATNRVVLHPSIHWQGILSDAKGDPLPGARVNFATAMITTQKQISYIDVKPFAVDWDGVTQVTTDAAGHWETDAFGADRIVSANFSAPGCVSDGIELNSAYPRGTDPARNTTVLSPAPPLTGRVVGPDGAPVPGVNVRFCWIKAVLATTDGNGDFRIDGFRPGKYALTFDFGTRPLVARSIVVDSSNATGNAPVVRAETGVLVSGTVRETDGTPVRTYVENVEAWPGVSYDESYAKADTDENGNFTLRLLPGVCEIATGHLPPVFANPDSQTVKITPAGAGPLNFIIRRSRLLNGTVVDQNGRPLSAAFVLAAAYQRAFGPDVTKELNIRSDSSGHFSVLVPFEGLAYLSHPDRFQVDMSPAKLDLPLLSGVRLVADRDSGRVLKVISGAAPATAPPGTDPVTITVLDEEGQPVAGALVRVFTGGRSTDGALNEVSQRTGNSGMATFDLAPSPTPGGPYGFCALYRKGYSFAHGSIAQTTLTFRLKRFPDAGGLVLDRKGRPIPGASVKIGLIYNPAFSGYIDFYYDGGFGGRAEAKATSVTTDAHGRWRLTSVPPHDEIDANVSAPNFATEFVREEAVPENACVLQPEARIQGRVSDPNRASLSGIKVHAKAAGFDEFRPVQAESVTDAAGRYVLRGLPAGTYQVGFDFGKNSCVAPTVEGFHASAGTNFLNVAAQPGVLVTGSVRDTSGAPIRTTVHTADGECVAATDVNGNYALRIPAGNQVLLDGAPFCQYFNRTPATIDAEPGVRPRLDFVLQPSAMLLGTVVDQSGKPLEWDFELRSAQAKKIVTDTYTDAMGFTFGAQGHFSAAVPFDGPAELGEVNMRPLGPGANAKETINLPVAGKLKITMDHNSRVVLNITQDSDGAAKPGTP